MMETFKTPKNRRLLAIVALASGIFFMLGALGSTQLPKLRSWILVKIETESRDHLPVRILPASVDVDFLPLGATLEGVKIFPKDELKDILEPTEIKRISASVSIWQLLQGKLRISAVEIEGARVSVRVPKPKKKDKSKPLEGLFAAIESIPVSRVNLNDVSVYAALEDPKLIVAVTGASIEARKQAKGFSLEIEDTKVRIRDPDSAATVLLDIEAAINANPSKWAIETLKVRRGDSFFMAEGEGAGDTEALSFKEYKLTVRSELVLESMRNWLKKTFANASWTKGIPPLKGRAFIDTKIDKTKNSHPVGDFKLRAENFVVEKLGLGHIEAAGNFKDDVVKIPRVLIKNSAGEITGENIQVDIKPETISLDGHVKVPSLDVHEMFVNFDLAKIPVYLSAKGDMPCKGTLKPLFSLECRAQVEARDIFVKDGLEKKSLIIAGIPEIKGNGIIRVIKDNVSFDADLSMPDSKGHTKGNVNFETGFKIDFEGERVAFKDVSHLANLKVEGVAKIKGSTEGNGHTGKVSLNLDGNDVWFENFWLGNAKANLSYALDQLHFADLNGNAGVSRYSGDVNLDLHAKKIAVNARLPFFDARDLLKVFSRRVQLSFPVLGTGQGSIKANGPLDLGHLSYDLKSSLFRGSVAGETFDQAHFDVKSVGGEVKAERVQMNKGAAVISLNGVAHPNGDIETMVHGRGLRLEDTNLVARSGLSLSGSVDFEMGLKGFVLAPDTNMRGALTRTSIGDQAMPDSNFQLKFNKNSIEGSGKFLGDVVDGDFLVPFNSESPFRLKVTTKNWNFAPIFAALAGPATRKDFEGNLTTKIDLSSPNGGFWNSTGQAVFEKVSLSRGSLKLQNPKPMLVTMKNGTVSLTDFNLSGESIFLNVEEAKNPIAKLDLLASGKIDLGLAALMTPFFEDLRGLLSFKLQVRGGDVPNQLLGSAYIEKGYLKFFDFPHAFEDIRADILFNQQKVLFNTVRADFGGGRILANGGMELKGYKNTPLNVTGTFEKITLNVPDKITTSGSGDFSFSGNGFPFLLKGNYVIADGLFTKNFGGDSNSLSSGIRRDVYLPDFLIEENFVPLIVDMNIDLSKGIAVKNELVDGRALGNLTIRGNPTKPAIGGTLACDRDTKVSFRDTEFEVVSANVQFNGTAEIDPKLYVSARARVDTYDVNLLVQGTGTKPDLLLSSVPPLPDRDIVSLLAFGATDQRISDKVKSGDQASNTGLQVGTGIVKHNPISDAIKERLGFDVQFSTGFDDSNTTVQKIVASRQVTPNLGVTAGYALGKSQSTEAKVRYRLNERLSLIGAYQGNNYTETNIQQQVTNQDPNKFGLDIEYKFEFK